MAEPWEQNYSAVPDQGRGMALARGIGQGALMGYLPQVSAAAGGLMPNPSASTDASLTSQGFKINQPEDTYLSRRDSEIAALKNASEQHPGYFYGGQGVGMIGTMKPVSAGLGLLPGLAAPAASTAGRLAQGGLAGGIIGAAQNPGDVQGQINPLQLEERAKNAAISAPVGVAASSIPELIKKIPGFTTKALSNASGIPEQDIQTYIKNTDEINGIIDESGGDLSQHSDLLRSKIKGDIISSKQELNRRLEMGLEKYKSAPPEVDPSPVVDALHKWQSKLNPRINSDQVEEVQGLVDKINGEATPEGKISVGSLNDIKKMLQDTAKPAYQSGQAIFQKGDETVKAARDAAKVARNLFNEEAPDLAPINQKLSALHGIEDNINKNIINPMKPDAALFTAGSGANPRNAMMLKQLGDFTGNDYIEQVKNLSAARQFANAPVFPIDASAKSGVRLAAAIGVGTASGHPGAALVASPMAQKAGINAFNQARQVGSAIKNVMPGMPLKFGSLGSYALPQGAARSSIQPTNSSSKEPWEQNYAPGGHQ